VVTRLLPYGSDSTCCVTLKVRKTLKSDEKSDAPGEIRSTGHSSVTRGCTRGLAQDVTEVDTRGHVGHVLIEKFPPRTLKVEPKLHL